MDVPGERGYLEEEYGPVFIGVTWWLEPNVIAEIGRSSTSMGLLARQLYRDNRFWKLRFEHAIGRTFPPDKQPGKTSWQWKYRQLYDDNTVLDATYEEDNLEIYRLYFSPEVFDVALAYSLLKTPANDLGVEIEHAGDAVTYSLAFGNVEVMNYLSSIPAFHFKEIAESTIAGDNYEYDAIIPIETIKILLDPPFNLRPDYRMMMDYFIRSDYLDGVKFLVTRPEIDLVTDGYHYLLIAAMSGSFNVFAYLLGLPEINLDERHTEMIYHAAEQRGFSNIVRILRTNDKTSAYFENK